VIALHLGKPAAPPPPPAFHVVRKRPR
jgi:hypothetical protein